MNHIWCYIMVCFWINTVVGAEVGSSQITPLVHELYSQKALDFISENEETIRFIKQSYDLDDFRVLTHERLKSMAALVLAASFFARIYLSGKAKLQILALQVINAAKPISCIPDFRYYALADGITCILTRVGKGVERQYKRPKWDYQLSLLKDL